MDSIWTESCRIPHRKPLQQNIKTQVAVIGAGLAGILTAYQLQAQGKKVAVLEADRIGSGQTSGTTAKITSQHGLIYHKLISQFGPEKAAQYARINQLAIETYFKLAAEYHIRCDLERKPAYLYTTGDPEPLIQETAAAQKLGLPASYVRDLSLPFPVTGAVCFDYQAQFHPLKFIKAISDDLTVYEMTPVRTVKDHTVFTDRYQVLADQIVFACHFPFLNIPGYYFARMHQERSYVIALKYAPSLEGMYLSIDQPAYSFRNAQNLLLLGGSGHRTGKNTEGGCYQALLNAAARWFPSAKEAARWSAQDCIPLDGVPYIGQFSADTPDWYVATGFQKWGMTSSMAASLLLSHQILQGSPLPEAEIFSPQRFPLAAVPKLLSNSAQAVEGLARQTFTVPRKFADEILPGCGKIVQVNGEKTGVYKDPDGTIYCVDVRCPHLGCQLEWNPDEKSWDCPCHGSRFDYTGKLLSGPAQTDISLS